MKRVALLLFVLLFSVTSCSKSTAITLKNYDIIRADLSINDPYTYFKSDDGDELKKLLDQVENIFLDDSTVNLTADIMNQVKVFYYITFVDSKSEKHQVCITNVYLKYYNIYYYDVNVENLYSQLERMKNGN